MGADPRLGPEAFGPAGKSAKEFLERVGEELRRADEVLIKLKRGGRGRDSDPPAPHDAPSADEFLRQLDRAALRLQPDPGPVPASTTFSLKGAMQLPVEHSPPEPSWWRENPGAPSSPPVPVKWTALPAPARGCSAVDEDLSCLLLCEDCRRLGLRLLRVAAVAVAADAPPREPPAPASAHRDVSTMVDRLRDMAAAVGEMQAALGGEERRSQRGEASRLRLARFSEV